jgi:hypothetical protein
MTKGKTFEDTGVGNYFLAYSCQEIRARNDKWDSIKLKSCTSKKKITRIKRWLKSRKPLPVTQ